jgi:hypothetical protein
MPLFPEKYLSEITKIHHIFRKCISGISTLQSFDDKPRIIHPPKKHPDDKKHFVFSLSIYFPLQLPTYLKKQAIKACFGKK